MQEALSSRANIMAEVEDISQEEADSMSPADPTPLTGPQMKALLMSKGVPVDGMVEKEELRSLVRRHATRTDMHDFLARARAAASASVASSSHSNSASKSAPSPSSPPSSSASSSSPSSSALPSDAELAAFAEQMKRNASMTRQNPNLFRANAPEPFKAYTDAQILGYADQCDRVAADPAMLKQAYAQMLAQRAAAGGGGGGGGGGAASAPAAGGIMGMVGQIGKWTDAELDAFVAEVKRDPATLRAQMVMAGQQMNMDEAKVDQIVGLIKNMDPSTLKTMLRLGQRFHGVAAKGRAACVALHCVACLGEVSSQGFAGG